MKFQKYPSIENTYRKDFLGHIIDEGKTDGTWVVTEKIHGANFSFWANKNGVRVAKRTCLIADDDNFYGSQKVREEFVEKIINLPYLMESPIKEIAIFGEIFGGSYPHPKVPQDSQAKKVQSGIYYCPDNQFMIFDIKVDDEYLDFSEMQETCEKAGLPYIGALFQGTFEECLKHKNKFSSTIHKYYHLPKIKDNICEGIVIRPNKTKFLSRGCGGGSRIILKSKNDKWSEKVHAKKPIESIELSAKASEIKEEIKSMITENRYNSVVSKIGEVTVAHFGQIMKDFNKDILEEAYKSELAYQFNALDKSEQKIVKKSMNHNIANLVRRKLILGE